MGRFDLGDIPFDTVYRATPSVYTLLVNMWYSVLVLDVTSCVVGSCSVLSGALRSRSLRYELSIRLVSELACAKSIVHTNTPVTLGSGCIQLLKTSLGLYRFYRPKSINRLYHGEICLVNTFRPKSLKTGKRCYNMR